MILVDKCGKCRLIDLMLLLIAKSLDSFVYVSVGNQKKEFKKIVGNKKKIKKSVGKKINKKSE
jgi:hypothetical protein